MRPLLLILAFLPLYGFAADGRETGNGGDPVAIEFMTSAFEAAMNIRNTPAGFSDLQNIDILSILEKTDIFVVDKPLKVVRNGVRQVSAAMNIRHPDRIFINRAAWNAIRNERLKQALALHEVLSLAGIEKTGVYKLVSQYDLVANKPVALPKYGMVWTFHSPSPAELKELRRFIPEMPGRKKPDTVAAVSQSLHFLARCNHVYQEVVVQILEYNLAEEGFFFQVVVTDAKKQVLAKDLVLDSPDFRITTDAFQQLEALQVDSSDRGDVGYRVHTIDGKHSYFLSFGLKRSLLKDIVSLPNDNEVLMLGKISEDSPYGLYLGRISSPPLLVKAFKQVIPGSDAKGNDVTTPRPVVQTILGVFRNDRGTYAVVNDLEGIVVVNVETGESKAVYEVPESGRFGIVLRNDQLLAGDTCIDLSLGIYNDDLGSIFYHHAVHSSNDGLLALPGDKGEDPLYVLHLGIEVTPQFFQIKPTGCR